MTRRLWALLSVAILAPTVLSARQAAPAAPLSARNANYTIDATLDAPAHEIHGTATLIWRNITAHPAADLRFHLYWNAWRDNQSSWMRERLSTDAALGNRAAADRSVILPTGWTINGRPPVDAHFIAPDDDNASDTTVLALTPDQAIGPGATAAITYQWTAHVPRPFARTGVIGNFYFIGQWFPKIGVLEDNGWNCHQFHSSTEFFSDFGTYDVTLTVPRGWIVGATGVEQSAADHPNGTTSHRFVQDDVHDFAWTTSPDYLSVHETFTDATLPSVDMRLLLQPEHAAQAARHFAATKAALASYGHWFGAYPYGHITIVDPPANFAPSIRGESMGGMEYPTLFTAGTRLIAPDNGASPESVVIHEAGHQFWYGIVATNEFENAWMDEGINTFSTARVMAEALPPRVVAVDRYFGGFIPWTNADVPWERDVDGNRLNQYRIAARSDVPSTPSWKYSPATAAAITYDKTALWLATLERYLGWDTLQKIMAAYFSRDTYQHPGPDVFFRTANEISGRDLTWYFDEVYRSTAVFDYGVGQVTSLPAPVRSANSRVTRIAQGFDNTVVVRRYADGTFPIDVRVSFSDGTITTEHWDGKDVWHAFEYLSPARVTRVEVDPDHVLLLDVNRTNNSWTSQPHAAAAARKWSARWLTWMEELLMSYGSFA